MAERKTYTAEDLKGCNGRRVLVEGVIEEEPSICCMGSVRFSHGPRHGWAYVDPSAIVEILPEQISVGDLVKTTGDAKVTVKAIVDDGERIALVKFRDGSYSARPLSTLTLLERG